MVHLWVASIHPPLVTQCTLCVYLKELHRRNQLHQDPSKTKALQTIIEMKVRAQIPQGSQSEQIPVDSCPERFWLDSWKWTISHCRVKWSFFHVFWPPGACWAPPLSTDAVCSSCLLSVALTRRPAVALCSRSPPTSLSNTFVCAIWLPSSLSADKASV